ncbi:hypothetical protein VYU27_010582, partial [Nannochloropsis oceanica]
PSLPLSLPPSERKEEANRSKIQLAGGEASDHKALLAAYEGWQDAEVRGQGRDFAWRNFLSGPTLVMVADMRKQFFNLLKDAGLLPQFDSRTGVGREYYNAHARSWPVVKAALLAGLYPNVIRVDYGKKRPTFFTQTDGTLKLHPSSINAPPEGDRGPPSPVLFHRWMMFFQKLKTPAGLFIFDTSEVSPLAVLLLGAGLPEKHGRLIPISSL